MPVLKFVVSVPAIDGTLDPWTNGFVYQPVSSGSADHTTASTLAPKVVAFYNATHAGMSGTSLLTWYSPSHAYAAGFNVKVYDLTGKLGSGAVLGPPIADTNVPIGVAAPSTTGLPDGTCGALSFRSDYGTDPEFVRDPVTHKVTARPRARHRGRIYLGPLGQNTTQPDPVTARCELRSVFIQDVMIAFKAVQSITDAGSNVWEMVQHSKHGAGTVAPLVECWMDDRPDYQRRRADQSLTKFSTPLP